MRNYTIYSLDKKIMIPLCEGGIRAIEPTGFGNDFSISYREGDRRRVVTKKKPSFGSIKFKLLFGADNMSPRMVFRKFMTLFADLGVEFILEENSEGFSKACYATLVNAPKSEIKKSGIIEETFEFDRLSYWFNEETVEFTINDIKDNSLGFPLSFPFSFNGVYITKELVISNNFYEPIPAIISVVGNAKNEEGKLNIFLLKKGSEDIVAQISLKKGLEENEIVVLDPESGKVTLIKNKVTEDAYMLTDKTKDTFLYIPTGTYVLKSDMLFSEGGKLGVTVRKYRFD